MARRISRAKRRIREAGATFGLVGDDERAARLREFLHVLYLVFNEGHTASEGPDLRRDDLGTEAIRLTRMLRAGLPTDGEVAGLLALMILTDARRLARTAPDGSLVPLLEQDRGAWDAAKIAEGTTLVTAALATAPVGLFQVQAATAALHTEARDAGATDWPQIVALYGVRAPCSRRRTGRTTRERGLPRGRAPDEEPARVGAASQMRTLSVRLRTPASGR